MITYNDIYEATRQERYSDQLQLLPKNFVAEVSKYLKDKNNFPSKNQKNFRGLLIKQKTA